MSRIVLRILKSLLPVVVLGVAAMAAYVMYINRPAVETQPPVIEPPSVRVQHVTFETVRLTVTSQGTVQPRTSSQLVPEISGTILGVAPSFAVGGFFEAGDVLLQIDPYDYQQALIAGRSQLAQAQLRLAQEEAEADVARREWEELGRGSPSALTLRQPQVEDARAAVASAEAAIDRAARDLERADVRAPYAGRVQSKDVDVGQFVNKGTAVGRVYAVDSAEIRLPLPDEELAYVDVPMSYRGGQRRTGPRVSLTADFAGRRHTWQGRIVRTESEIDPVSRMVHVVAEVSDPYAPGSDPTRPPLAAGMFVEAEIEGRSVDDILTLPWAALRGRDQVLIVDDAGQLRFRQVEVLRSTTDQVLIRSGLAEGERVCISALDTVIDGMAVRVLDEDTRLTRVARGDAPPTSTEEVPALARDTARAGETARVEVDSSGSQDEPASTLAQTAESVRPRPRARADAPATARFELDPTTSRSDQIVAIRREIARLRGTSPGANAPLSPPARSAAAGRPSVERPATAAAATPPSTNARTTAGERPPIPAATGSRGPGGAQSDRAGAPADRGEPGGGDRVPTARATETAPPAPRGETTPPSPRPEPVPEPVPEPESAPPAPRPVAVDAPITVESPAPLVAVLPFINLSRNPADDVVATEVASVLVAALGGPAGMRVVSLTTADDPDALAAAAARNARWLVGGGYQRIGDQLRVTARVLDVRDGQLLGSVKLDGTFAQRQALTSELVAAVRSELGGEGRVARTATTVDPAPAPVTPRLSIALSPFTNISRNPADDRIRGAVADAIAGGLGPLEGLSVLVLNTSDTDETAALPSAAARGAAWLVEGGYQQVGGQLRITARLLDVSSGTSVESVKVDGPVDQLPQLLSEVVSTLRAALESRTAGQASAAAQSL